MRVGALTLGPEVALLAAIAGLLLAACGAPPSAPRLCPERGDTEGVLAGKDYCAMLEGRRRWP